MGDGLEAGVLARANRLGPNKPLLVSFTFDGKTLRTFQGLTPEECARFADIIGAAALGVNCGREMDIAASAEVLTRYRAVSSLRLFARPNAGTPGADGTYPRAPEMMAAQLPKLLQAGALMVGGCCGTTPPHICAFREAIDAWKRRGA
jgi:5-methyltetrahydrofolate--homocysteine methyltransferase